MTLFSISSSVLYTLLLPETRRVAIARVSRRKETNCHVWCLKKQKINVAGQGKPIVKRFVFNSSTKKSSFFFSTEGDRAYGFVRIETGDELSKRAKFAFITWIGESVSGLLKGKVSTDKSVVKQIIQVRVK